MAMLVPVEVVMATVMPVSTVMAMLVATVRAMPVATVRVMPVAMPIHPPKHQQYVKDNHHGRRLDPYLQENKNRHYHHHP